MEGILFFSLILLLLIFVFATQIQSIPVSKPDDTKPTKEGFVSGTPGGVVAVPTPGPPAQPLKAGERAEAYAPVTGNLPSAPFGEISDVTSRPYKDPELEKATYARIYSLQQDMRGFAAFEVEKLQNQSDPAIQLPLSNFRGDLQILDDEVAFLNRNPGIESNLTVSTIRDIRVNLTYLQRKAREVQGGFFDGARQPLTTEGFADAADDDVSPKATKDQIDSAILKINVEVARLTASGTTSPVYTTRITLLNKIKGQLQTISTQLKNKTLQPADVPITKKDLDAFLPTLSDINTPIGKLFDDAGLPTLSSLFPTYALGDISGANLAAYIFQNYGDALTKGLSWDVNLKYTSKYDLDKTYALANLAKNVNSAPSSSTNSSTNVTIGTTNSLSRGEFEDTINNIREGMTDPNLDYSGIRPEFKSVETAAFDWKERSSQICEAVRLRGLDPADFGCYDAANKVGPDFSWRGYARMICTRLTTTPDPSLPETCGCPPIDWKGWRQ